MTYIFQLICILMAAVLYAMARNAHKDGQHFFCGFSLMFALYFTLYLIRATFGI